MHAHTIAQTIRRLRREQGLTQRPEDIGVPFDLSAYARWAVRLQREALFKKADESISALQKMLAALDQLWPTASSPFRRYLRRQALDLRSLRAGLLGSLADPSDDTYAFLREGPRFQALLAKEM